MGALGSIRASRRSAAQYHDSLITPEALASCPCPFLLSPSQWGTIGQSVATVCQLCLELQSYSYPALQERQRECSMRLYWLLGTSVRKMTTFSPHSRFSLGAELDEETGGTCTSRSFREEIPFMEAKLTLSGSMDSGKLRASSMRSLLATSRLVTVWSIPFCPL